MFALQLRHHQLLDDTAEGTSALKFAAFRLVIVLHFATFSQTNAFLIDHYQQWMLTAATNNDLL